MYRMLMCKRKLIVTLLIPLLFSCTEVKLIGAYNQNVDQSIQTMSKDVSTLFVQIENNIDDSKDYSYNALRDSYVKIEGEIQSCITVADGIPKYKIISDQLTALSTAMLQLKQHNQSGFVAPGVTDKATIKKTVELDKSAFTTAFTAMLALQEGLKREKATK